MSKQPIDKKHNKKQRKSDIWVILIISVFAIAIVAMIIISKLPKQNTPATPTSTNSSGLNMGNPDAKVKVVEFADFQCPYCQLYYQQLEPTIVTTYVDTNLIYYTYAPLAFLGQESVDATEAAYCASDQGKFWEYRGYLYTNLTGENVGSFTQDKLINFAKQLDLDVNTFTTCLTNAQHAQDIADASTYAQSVGINSTPSFLVNGTVVSASGLQAAIDSALAQ